MGSTAFTVTFAVFALVFGVLAMPHLRRWFGVPPVWAFWVALPVCVGLALFCLLDIWRVLYIACKRYKGI